MASISIDTNGLSTLQCPVCFQYLIGNIFICATGHNICSHCKEQLSVCPTCRDRINNTRNFALEEMMQSCKFSCELYKNGCRKQMKAQELEDHAKICEYRKYKCPFCSGWEGLITNLRDHLTHEHDARQKKLSLKSKLDISGTEDQNYQIGQISNFYLDNTNLFYFHRYLIDKRIIYFLQCIGNTEKAANYGYSIEACCLSNTRKINCTEICASDLQTAEEIVQSSCYISIPANYGADSAKISLELINNTSSSAKNDSDKYEDNDYDHDYYDDYFDDPYDNNDYEDNDYDNNDYEDNDYDNNDYEDDDYNSCVIEEHIL